ncbi:MAG: DUF1003 domain-containing protein [Mycobacterium sp.]
MDSFVAWFGSLRFIAYQTVIVGAWIVLNIAAYALAWDPYPFILLNLVFSTQAAYAAPLILLSQNRAAEHDRMRAEEDYVTNNKALAELKALRSEHADLRAIVVSVAARSEKTLTTDTRPRG